MIANYQYYTGTYKGTRFTTEAAFNKAEQRAEQELKNYINTGAESFTDAEKMCCCSLSDIVDIFKTNDEKNIKGITNESVSGYSVSFSSSSDNYKFYKERMKSEIKFWLGDSMINFRGVGRNVL